MEQKTLDGYTFEEWCKKIKKDFLENGYDKMANDNEFVEKVAKYSWDEVLDNNCYSLEDSLAIVFGTIEEEYNIHIEPKKIAELKQAEKLAEQLMAMTFEICRELEEGGEPVTLNEMQGLNELAEKLYAYFTN